MVGVNRLKRNNWEITLTLKADNILYRKEDLAYQLKQTIIKDFNWFKDVKIIEVKEVV